MHCFLTLGFSMRRAGGLTRHTWMLRLWLLAGIALAAGSAEANLKPMTFEGQRYLRIDEMATFYKGHLVPAPNAESVTLKSPLADVEFKVDSREVRIGGTVLWLHEPVRRIRGSWAMREVDALTGIDPVMRPGEYLKKAGHRVVVLDPGHGAMDTGAKSRGGVEEKRAVLDIARRVRSHLSAAGVVVYMTRENDRFIELEERAKMARRWGADLFVSIHLNSAASRDARGTETFIMAAEGLSSTVGGNTAGHAKGNVHNAANAALGFQLQRALVKQSGNFDRGLKRARFIVLRQAPCPAALVECAFLSNPDEEKSLMQEAYRDRLARGIARGIINYVTLARQAQKKVTP